MQVFERKKGSFLVSTDVDLLDINISHRYIHESYWATGIPRDIFLKSIKNSLCFGLYEDSKQIGFARIVSDYSTFAYLGDVFVINEYRGKGLSKWLMEVILEHPELQNLRRFCLGTKDAQELYRKYGFEEIKIPENWMEIKRAGIYLSERESVLGQSICSNKEL